MPAVDPAERVGRSCRGGQPAASVEAATSSTVFRAYLTQVLPPELPRSGRDAVPAIGNPGPTRRPAYANCSTAPVSPTADPGPAPTKPDPGPPPRSPDLDPIEPAWVQGKAELRRVAVRDEDTLASARPSERPRLRLVLLC